MRNRLIQALIFLSSRSSESDKSYKKQMRQIKERRNVNPGIFTDRLPARPHQFYFLSGREQKYFSMTALRVGSILKFSSEEYQGSQEFEERARAKKFGLALQERVTNL